MCVGGGMCVYTCVFLKQINISIFNLNSREWAFSLFRTLKEMVSYANCSFMDNYTMGYQSNLIKLWQLPSLTFLQLVKLWHWGKWLWTTPWGLAFFKASIVYWNVTSLLWTCVKHWTAAFIREPPLVTWPLKNIWTTK